MGYSIATPTSWNNNSDAVQPKDGGILKSISPKVNVITHLEFEFVSFLRDAFKHLSFYATGDTELLKGI